MSENKSTKMVIVDEGASDGNLMRFKRFAEEKGLEGEAYGGLTQEVDATGKQPQHQRNPAG